MIPWSCIITTMATVTSTLTPMSMNMDTVTGIRTVVNRLARAIGHLESVKRMVEDGRDCTDVLIQLAAVRSALNNTAKIILKDHIEHCISDADHGDGDSLQHLNDAIDKFI